MEKQTSQARTWFRQKPYVLTTAGVLLLYSMIASQSRELLAWVDLFLSPAVDSLHWIGLGVSKPFMDGPMPERFYSNLVGIGVWGVLVFNVRAIFWYAREGVKKSSKTQAMRQSVRNRWGRTGLFLTIAVSYSFTTLLFIYLVMTFLNGLHGWFVFHVRDFMIPPAFVMMWVFPGALIVALGWPILWAAGNELLGIFRAFSSSLRSEQ